ncbi:MAG: hypothetical protein IH619_02690 [Ignavibacterium sp.]|nr:hypothetical protein [Ignavibacterium sp.]
MQPIALNTKVIADLINDWVNVKSQRSFFKLTENLEQFHQVYIDKNENGSKWLDQFREIRNSIIDQNIKRIFDDLIGPRNIKYNPVQISQVQDPFIEVTSKTPDKLGISSIHKNLNDLMFYDLPSFNSVEYTSQNFLFRIPKNITIAPGEEFRNLRLFESYLRNASRVEFCDLFLFKNPQYEDDAEFIFMLLKLCENIREVEIHCEPNNLNILQMKVKKRLKNEFGNRIFDDFKKYNPPTRDVNHDRFIIIDTDKISIRFTTSFNNLRKTNSGGFKAKDSFLIEFSSGRKYYD